jgi:hypothetical protein
MLLLSLPSPHCLFYDDDELMNDKDDKLMNDKATNDDEKEKRRDYGIVDEGKEMGAKGRDAKGGKGGNGKGGKGIDGKGGKTSYPSNGLLYNHSMWHDDNDDNDIHTDN